MRTAVSRWSTTVSCSTIPSSGSASRHWGTGSGQAAIRRCWCTCGNSTGVKMFDHLRGQFAFALVGLSPTHADPGPGPARHLPSLLGTPGREALLRFGNQGPAGLGTRPGRSRSLGHSITCSAFSPWERGGPCFAESRPCCRAPSWKSTCLAPDRPAQISEHTYWELGLSR